VIQEALERLNESGELASRTLDLFCESQSASVEQQQTTSEVMLKAELRYGDTKEKRGSCAKNMKACPVSH